MPHQAKPFFLRSSFFPFLEISAICPGLGSITLAINRFAPTIGLLTEILSF
jgi:hypothetical protein